MPDLETPFVKLVLELPTTVAEQLIADGELERAVKFRAPIEEFATILFTVANAGATVVTLAQSPDVVRKVQAALKRWRVEEELTEYELTLRGPSGTVSVTISNSDDVDLTALFESVS